MVVAALLVVLAACSSASRPSVAEWQPAWDQLIGGIPTVSEIGQPPDRSLCTRGLGLVRSSQAGLFPTPDRAIDDAVNEWVSVAEDAFFECPPSSSAIPDMDFAYGQLARLEAEVDAVLVIDRSQ
jgi:hypothetical protein